MQFRLPFWVNARCSVFGREHDVVMERERLMAYGVPSLASRWDAVYRVYVPVVSSLRSSTTG
jgi:hypothetical protein